MNRHVILEYVLQRAKKLVVAPHGSVGDGGDGDTIKTALALPFVLLTISYNPAKQ
jgi:hypothetical protein